MQKTLLELGRSDNRDRQHRTDKRRVPSKRITLPVACFVAVLERLAASVAPCEVRLRVKLTQGVPDPIDAGSLRTLLRDHSDYRLTVQRQIPEDPSVVALVLTGPGPTAGCREVINSMRKDVRVVSVQVPRNAAITAQTPSMARSRSPQAASCGAERCPCSLSTRHVHGSRRIIEFH